MSKRYIIIGFGVCGISTALHLLGRKSSVEVIILSHRQSSEPSSDDSKIIRIDYTNPQRMKEAIQAQKRWRIDAQFSSFYQPVGRIIAYDRSLATTLTQINATRIELGLRKRSEQDKAVFEDMYGESPISCDSIFVWNDDDGMVEWAGCMEAARVTIQRRCQESEGSKILEVSAEKLIYKGGRITSIALANSEEIEATDAEVIVAAGPWIAEFLDSSDIAQAPVSRMPVATGVFAFKLQLDVNQRQFFKGKPVFSHNGCAEFLPPTRDDGVAKITWISSFTNTRNGSGLSYARDLSKSSLAIQAMLDMKHWAGTYIPRLKSAKIMQINSYWDGMTQTQEPIISRHPGYENLSVMGGLSYTRAKDLPTIGEEMIKVINGEPINLQYAWHPNTTSSYQDNPRLLAKGNFEDLEVQAESDPKVQAWRLNRALHTEMQYLEEI